MANSFNWACPHCHRDTTIVADNYVIDKIGIWLLSVDGYAMVSWVAILCPNEKCKKLTLTVSAHTATKKGPDHNPSLVKMEPLGRGQVRFFPASSAKTFPEYVPEPVRRDYEEACSIIDLSPKASATLSRRALQGILRDFWKVKPGRLKDEIDSIQNKCDADTWEAIEAVRKIGNIGAHMEKDIDVIIDVDPHEAELLTGLIETLVDDWYITRAQRASRMQELKKLAESKKPQNPPQ